MSRDRIWRSNTAGRRGGNLTGVSVLATEVTAKRLELLSELVPRAGVIALLVTRTARVPSVSFKRCGKRHERRECSSLSSRPAPRTRSMPLSARSMNWAAGALLVGADPFLSGRREQLV